ncbi:ABC transporter ATP-binding protein [Solibacillus sp. MA9]|uniref:ABC transporter ATP-binding protein n=1 Tax=Solibacillus palustris TaxID=2908203 RepID=A0ABS9U924_9BACL|nr:ABC transporter ATP-binding protein [Solibacillus sp. MA9]MCH7320468.1 ABC transporter ATP-binding protein [Solibacillus sp. MA9]
MTTIIDVQNMRMKFGSEEALKDVSFSIKKGEIFGFLGPSGSGKTTTIKILTAQLTQSSGHAFVFGQPASDMHKPQQKAKIGLLTDNSGLYQRLTVEENLLLYSNLYGISNNAVEEALQFVNLQNQRKKKVSQLSKGMLQRVILARTIMHKPQLLFLDEPTSALDPVNAQHIYRGLRKLNELGTTIFLTTHNMAEAELLCDRVAFLHKGEIRELDTPAALKKKYSDHSFTIELDTGERHVVVNGEEDAVSVMNWMKNDQIARMHSNEPSLGDIFVKLTGSDLL